jgi:hypothetical protein
VADADAVQLVAQAWLCQHAAGRQYTGCTVHRFHRTHNLTGDSQQVIYRVTWFVQGGAAGSRTASVHIECHAVLEGDPYSQVIEAHCKV